MNNSDSSYHPRLFAPSQTGNALVVYGTERGICIRNMCMLHAMSEMTVPALVDFR